jgi:hypothetical protein
MAVAIVDMQRLRKISPAPENVAAQTTLFPLPVASNAMRTRGGLKKS